MSIQDIIDKLTATGVQFADMVDVGKNYTKAELISDLRNLLPNDEDE